ncbi:MAG: sugar phosphate isomerase/epimerase [Clostridiales bacterium]|nr:sugar phosphate isomerase/epimerase [Clostridiales bacterium]
MKELAVVISNDNKNVTPIETIDAIVKAGFKNVFLQWYNKEWEVSQEEQLKYAREKGLNVIFVHLGYRDINKIWEEGEEGDNLIDYYKKDLFVCKQNNIDLVVMHPVSKSVAPIYNELGLKRFKEIIQYAKELNIKIAFENTKIKGYLEYILQNIDSDNIGICYDAGHCHAHFNDEFNYEIFKDKIFAVHLHDNHGSEDWHLIPFDGTINWKHVISKLKECRYNGPVTLELCYRKEYLKMPVEDFYKKGYEIGEKLSEMFEK